MKKQILNTDSYSPLYKQLMQKLRSDIQNGVYPVHSRIPSEQELCDTYQVSRVTVRKALAELTQEGLLNRHQGKGTFVGVPRIRKDLRDVNSFHDICRVMGSVPTTRLLHVQWVYPEETDARELNCEPGEQVLEIVRLRLADDIPVMLETNRFPADYGWLSEADLTGSLYALLAEKGVELYISCGLCVGHDAIFNMNAAGPVTNLVVKDRLMAHNPLGVIYSRYWKRKLGIMDEGEV